MAVQRALAELDFAPGELAEDQYEVTIIIPPEEGFMGVGAVDAVVEVALTEEALDFFGPGLDAQPEELLDTEDERRLRRGLRRRLLPLTDQGAAARLRVFLERVLRELGLDAQVRITESPDELHAEITGEDLGILIGRRGQTIDAVEYLASIAVFPGLHIRKHVELDAEGYKERRRRADRARGDPQGSGSGQARSAGPARSDDSGGEEDRPPDAEGSQRCLDCQRGPRAEPIGDYLAASLSRPPAYG